MQGLYNNKNNPNNTDKEKGRAVRGHTFMTSTQSGRWGSGSGGCMQGLYNNVDVYTEH